MSRGKSKLHLFFTLTIERKCPPRMNIIVIQIHPAADLWQSVRHAGRSNMGGGSLKIVFGKTIDLAVMIVKRDFHREVVQMIYARPLRPADARRIRISNVSSGLFCGFLERRSVIVSKRLHFQAVSVTKPEIRADGLSNHLHMVSCFLAERVVSRPFHNGGVTCRV